MLYRSKILIYLFRNGYFTSENLKKWPNEHIKEPPTEVSIGGSENSFISKSRQTAQSHSNFLFGIIIVNQLIR
jgi:hypothetical protein